MRPDQHTTKQDQPTRAISMTIPTENIDAMVQFLTDVSETSGDHFMRAADMLRAQQQKLVELEAKCAMTLGVGDGRGQLFVHGDGDSIRACRDKLLRMEELNRVLRDIVEWFDAGDVEAAREQVGRARRLLAGGQP